MFIRRGRALQRADQDKLNGEIVLAGDLNVAPRDVDVHAKGLDHMKEEKKKTQHGI